MSYAFPAKRIAAVRFDRTIGVDKLMREAAAALKNLGLNLAGVIQTPSLVDNCDVRSVRLMNLGSGREVEILQDLGKFAQGCRLNPQTISDVAADLHESLSKRPDLLIINRFGRAEAEGHGLRQILERAATDGVPVLIAVREDYVDDWNRFHGGMAQFLSPRLDDILTWSRALQRAESRGNDCTRQQA